MANELSTDALAVLRAVGEAVANLSEVAADALVGASERAESRVLAQQERLREAAALLAEDPASAQAALQEATAGAQYQDILRQELEAVTRSLRELAALVRADANPKTWAAGIRGLEPREDIDPDRVDADDAGPPIELF